MTSYKNRKATLGETVDQGLECLCNMYLLEERREGLKPNGA